MKSRSGEVGCLGSARALLVAWLAPVLLMPCFASAAERRTVRAVFAGNPAAVQRIVKVLRASLEQEGLDIATSLASTIDPLDAVRVASEPSADTPVAYLWLDLAAKRPTLFLVSARSHLVYARPLDVHSDPDQVETELIRFVVDQSLNAILTGNAPGVTPEEFQRSLATAPDAPPVTPAPPSASSPQAISSAPTHPVAPRLRWAFTAGYSLSGLDADAVAHGPELSAELRASNFEVKLRLAQRLPLTVTRNEASLTLVSSGARLIASGRTALNSGLSMSLGLGAGLDATRVIPAADGAVPAFWVSDPLLLSQLAVEQTWRGLLVSVYGGGEWDPIVARYTILRPGGSSIVWTPSQLRPCFGVSLGYAFY